MSQQDHPPLQRTGRGGAGNYHPPNTLPTSESISKDHKPISTNEVKYVHHGRGGAGNLFTTSEQVKPVESVVENKIPSQGKVAIVGGRGGAGNIRTASQDRERERERKNEAEGWAVDVSVDEEAARGVQEPALVHLGEGREVVHDS